jgi:hypothetical protein
MCLPGYGANNHGLLGPRLLTSIPSASLSKRWNLVSACFRHSQSALLASVWRAIDGLWSLKAVAARRLLSHNLSPRRMGRGGRTEFKAEATGMSIQFKVGRAGTVGGPVCFLILGQRKSKAGFLACPPARLPACPSALD